MSFFYAIGDDAEVMHGPYPTAAAAMAEARADLSDRLAWGDLDRHGQATVALAPAKAPNPLTVAPSGDQVIETLLENADAADGDDPMWLADEMAWLSSVSEVAHADLDRKLRATIVAWLREHDLWPEWRGVGAPTYIDVAADSLPGAGAWVLPDGRVVIDSLDDAPGIVGKVEHDPVQHGLMLATAPDRDRLRRAVADTSAAFGLARLPPLARDPGAAWRYLDALAGHLDGTPAT